MICIHLHSFAFDECIFLHFDTALRGSTNFSSLSGAAMLYAARRSSDGQRWQRRLSVEAKQKFTDSLHRPHIAAHCTLWHPPRHCEEIHVFVSLSESETSWDWLVYAMLFMLVSILSTWHFFQPVYITFSSPGRLILRLRKDTVKRSQHGPWCGNMG